MTESKGSSGIFAIPLDFESNRAMRDAVSLDRYRQNLEGVHLAVPEMLKVFAEKEIHATWATVGFLFRTDADDLKLHQPGRKPGYRKTALSHYPYIASAE